MDSELKKNWIEALRSGEYKQGTGRLRGYSLNDNTEVFCCLGVLCEISNDFVRTSDGYMCGGFYLKTALTDVQSEKFGLDRTVLQDGERIKLISKLINLNDDEEWNFEQIARYLEKIKF